jgi:hypothetical protein
MPAEDNIPNFSASKLLEELEADPLAYGEVPGRMPADTGERVASLAGKYGDFTTQDLLRLISLGTDEAQAQFAADVRSMAASLRRQNER